MTLQHVAEQAGVHPMTVSRALKGSDKVAPATRENIQRIARQLNYTPNVAARALVIGKTETIAVVTGPVSEHFYAHLLHLLEIELKASNYKMLFLRGRDLAHELLSLVNANAVDGVIAIDAFPGLHALAEPHNSFIPPLIYAGVVDPAWETSSFDTIKVDLSHAMRHAVQAMLDTGSRRTAYLAANDFMASSHEVRARVYKHIIESAGQPVEIINLKLEGDTSNHEGIRSSFAAYIEAQGCPDGLLCQNDEMAIAAFRVLRDCGFRVPDDVQLVGCDGLTYMDCIDPQLSTIVQPAEQMCALAWQVLQQRMTDAYASRQQITIEAHLRVRSSLKLVPTLTQD